MNPVFQWKINGATFGGNESAASIPARVGDVIHCEISGTTPCGQNIHVSSNSITIQSSPGYNQGPEVVIGADKQTVCSGTKVTFAATNKSESANPAFQWLLNGAPVGTNSQTFSTTALADGDKVECVMTVPHCGSNGGTTKGHSNVITLKVDAVPVIQFNPATVVIEPGSVAQLRPVVQGNMVSHQWTPASFVTDPTTLSPVTKPLNSTTTFQLQVQTSAGCAAVSSITVTVYSGLFIPTAFTPNGDGKNDVFRIPPTAAFTLKEFVVFDRWGNNVFSTRDITKGWDGKKKGINASADTYVYVIRGEDNKGPVSVKGTVQLFR
jgi:gliding motility-associated-like protein